MINPLLQPSEAIGKDLRLDQYARVAIFMLSIGASTAGTACHGTMQPYEYAALASHVYELPFGINQEVSSGDPVILQEPSYVVLSDWQVRKVYHIKNGTEDYLERLTGWQQGHSSALYYNKKKKQMVWAFRGAEINNLHTMHTLVTSVIQNRPTVQTDLTRKLAPIVLELCQQYEAMLSLTGHSLGGFLATIAAFHLYPAYCRVVAFDPLSARDFLLQIGADLADFDLDKLDVSNYLPWPSY